MKTNFQKFQSILVYAVLATSIALFILYLGFMTHYYVLFYDGTFEMYEYYKTLQVLNKEGFKLVVNFVVLAFVLLIFGLNKTRPGLFGLAIVIGTTVYDTMSSLQLINVIPKYRRGYTALDFTSMEEYMPSTLAFDAGVVLHYVLIGLLGVLTIISLVTFVQRLKEGKPLVRKYA